MEETSKDISVIHRDMRMIKKELEQLRNSVRKIYEVVKGGSELMSLEAAAIYCGYGGEHFRRVLKGSGVKTYRMGRKIMVETESLNRWIRGHEEK